MSSIEGLAPHVEHTLTAEDARRRPNRLHRMAAAMAGFAMLSGIAACASEQTEPPTPTPAEVQPTPTPTPTQTTEVQPNRPNIVEIMVDDLDKKPMRYMTIINKELRDKGVTLTNFQTEQSLCCPSRATSFTGKYEHNHGVDGNAYPGGGYATYHAKDEMNSLPEWLHALGYITSFMGKYFNQYPRPYYAPDTGVSDSYIPPGWDKWASLVEGAPYDGFHYKMNINGKVDAKYREKFFGDTLACLAISTLKDMPTDKPFFMTIRPYTPHTPFAYPKRMAHKYTNVHYPHNPNFNEADISDKVNGYNHLPLYGPAKQAEFNRDFRKRLRGMKVVDHMVGQIIRTLIERGELNNTYIVFTSDNGYMFGEHRMETKYKEFNESQEVPMIVRGPGIPAGERLNTLTGNIDLAPTYLDIAGAQPRSDIDGLSLLPLLTGAIHNLPRHYMLMTRGNVPVGPDNPQHGLDEPQDETISPEQGIRNNFTGVVSSDGLKYVQFRFGDRFELYDENKDPYELNNLFGSKGDEELKTMPDDLRRKVIGMRKALRLLQVCKGADCTLPDLTPSK